MSYGRRLPDVEILLEHLRKGLTYKQIGDLYGVTGEAVRQKLMRNNVELPRQRPSHQRFLPWTVRADHAHDLLARRLRLYSRSLQGYPIGEAEQRQLAEWQAYMDGDNKWRTPLSVHYERSQGFWLEPRREGDEHYISLPKGKKERK